MKYSSESETAAGAGHGEWKEHHGVMERLCRPDGNGQGRLRMIMTGWVGGKRSTL